MGGEPSAVLHKKRKANMTVRELIQKILSEAPDLDAEVYFETEEIDYIFKNLKLSDIKNYGSNDGLFFIFKNTI